MYFTIVGQFVFPFEDELAHLFLTEGFKALGEVHIGCGDSPLWVKSLVGDKIELFDLLIDHEHRGLHNSFHKACAKEHL